jgi:hypothetical protein
MEKGNAKEERKRVRSAGRQFYKNVLKTGA